MGSTNGRIEIRGFLCACGQCTQSSTCALQGRQVVINRMDYHEEVKQVNLVSEKKQALT